MALQLRFDRDTRGPPRATKLGLTSSRYHEHHISKNAKEAIEYVKLRDRPYLKVLLPSHSASRMEGQKVL